MNLDTFRSQLADEIERLSGWLVSLPVNLLQVAVIVFGARWFNRRLRRRALSARMSARMGRNTAVFMANAITGSVFLAAGTLILSVFGANWTAVLTALGAFSVALSLSLQDVLRNIFSGAYLLIERPFLIGEQIKVRDVVGTVESIELRSTTIRSVTGERVHVPNSVVFTEVVTNRTAVRFKRLVLTLEPILAAPGEAFIQVNDAIHSLSDLAGPPPSLTVTKVTGDGVTVRVELWHRPDTALGATVSTRLREAFPDSAVTVEP